MDFPLLKQLPLLNSLLLASMSVYLGSKAYRHRSVFWFAAALVPLIVFQIGTYFFLQSSSRFGPVLVVLAINLIPLTFVPFGQVLGRESNAPSGSAWRLYYVVQILLLAAIITDLVFGHFVEWVTGVLDQPVIIIEKTRRFFFLNPILGATLTLLAYENTFKNASRTHIDALKCIVIAYIGFIVYVFYLSAQVILTSYIGASILFSGSGIIFLGILLLGYSLLKYPFWQVKIAVSRRAVLGSLSITTFFLYLIVSGVLINFLHWVRPAGYNTALPALVFFLAASFLLIYFSPNAKRTFELFITKHFFRNRYDYRDLWLRFSEKLSGCSNLEQLLPKVSEFIADSMLIKNIGIWLRVPESTIYKLEFREPMSTQSPPALHMDGNFDAWSGRTILRIPDPSAGSSDEFPIDHADFLRTAGFQRVAPIEKDGNVLGLLAIGNSNGDQELSAEDDRLLWSISKQLAHLILNQRLSEELLLAREWESFNRFSSFIVHDLKNLATMQSMTLENAQQLGGNPTFLADAFETFRQTTEKMMNLIAGLSLQRGKFSLKKRPVNLLDVLSSTFDDLKMDQRTGLIVTTNFPPKDMPPMIAGDPDLLKKVFTNLLLNAIQSLPEGEGAVEVTVAHPGNGRITAGIKDTGCGIPPEQIKNLFRPFQTTKSNGMGIGLCHTRSIVEVHGGRIHIESQLNAGTEVEVEFPTL
ncbi:MAG TPA: XrtA/PEP-CTERM system histidine kinase PrsK [Candidatus Binatia bacterium]